MTDKTKSEVLEDVSLEVAGLISVVMDEHQKGRIHKFAAIVEIKSPIITPGKQKKKTQLVGVMVPIELALKMNQAAFEVFMDRERGAGNVEG